MKKLLATLLLGAALAVAALPVSARGTDGTVTLTADGNAAAVSLALPQEAAQGVTALRLSFEVESSEPVEAEFIFDAALPGTVQQYRYDAASGRLNVYVAGREDLLPDGNAALGEVRVESSQTGTATVRVVQDSLELVDAALAKNEATTSSNGEVSLTLDGNGGTTQPEVTPKPSEQPSGGSTSNQRTPSNQTAQSSPKPTTVTAAAPAPTAAPNAAVQQPTAQSGSGSKKPAGSKATPAPSATPEPDEETKATATPAPTASPEAATETATPEQTQSEQTAATGLPMAVIVVIACLAAAVLIGVLVIRFRNR